jgi:pimeloyl-ACP methyl ester carboxylesterase
VNSKTSKHDGNEDCKTIDSIRSKNGMSIQFDVLWLNVSPSLKALDRPLLNYLSKTLSIAQWEYCQSDDEASSLEKAIALLHEYLQQLDRPVHLAGHGLGGVLALSYARRYPNRVRSLSLLSVAAQAAATWHAHYYVQRHLLTSFSKPQLLAHLVKSLFGEFASYPTKALISALDRDLSVSPNLHSLFEVVSLPKASVAVPMMVCGSSTDPIVSPTELHAWHAYLKPSDVMWKCPDGRHFFHFAFPQQTGDRLLKFWQHINAKVPPDQLIRV